MTVEFAFPTIPHLAASQGTPDDTFMDLAESLAILPRTTVVQPKRDGLNLGVRFCGCEIEVILKNRPPDDREWEALAGFRAELIPRLTALHKREPRGVRIFGELDVSLLEVSSWFVFDVFSEAEHIFLHHKAVSSLAAECDLAAIPWIRLGPVACLGELDDLLDEDPHLEGLVLRCEDRGRVERFKYVRPGFEKSVWTL